MSAKSEFTKVDEMIASASKRLSELRMAETDAYIAWEDAKYNAEDVAYKKVPNSQELENLRVKEMAASTAYTDAKYNAEGHATILSKMNRLREVCLEMVISELHDDVMEKAIAMAIRIFDSEMLPHRIHVEDGWITIYIERLDRRASIDMGNAEEIMFSYHSTTPPSIPTTWGVYADDDVAITNALTTIQNFIFE